MQYAIIHVHNVMLQGNVVSVILQKGDRLTPIPSINANARVPMLKKGLKYAAIILAQDVKVLQQPALNAMLIIIGRKVGQLVYVKINILMMEAIKSAKHVIIPAKRAQHLRLTA